MNCRIIDFFLPKTRNYWCNGTGRDTYIYTNSGGFTTKSSKPLLNMGCNFNQFSKTLIKNSSFIIISKTW